MEAIESEDIQIWDEDGHEGEMLEKGFIELIWDLEDSYDWSYVEHEGKDRVRFDWGDKSLWVNRDGSVEGQVPTAANKIIQRIMFY
jgi:hypothetical protein